MNCEDRQPRSGLIRWSFQLIASTESANMKAAELADFIGSRMRMSHIYQPVLVKTPLEHGGNASRREIAQAFLAHDESQIEILPTDREADARPRALGTWHCRA